MLTRVLLLISLAGVILLVGSVKVTAQGPQPQAPQVPLGTSFTYQGQLKKNGVPVNNTCSMTFSLWDSPSGGTKISIDQTASVLVANGLFTVVLSGLNQSGLNAFDGQERWLLTAVQCPGDSSAVTLTRQRLTAVPYADYALGPWLTNGNDIGYYGRVGIGTALPSQRLEIDGSALIYPRSGPSLLFLHNRFFADYSQVVFVDGAGTYRGYLGYIDGDFAADPSRRGHVEIGTNGKDLVFRPNESELMRLTAAGVSSAGRVGIGSTNPLATLHVRGTYGIPFPTSPLYVENAAGQFGLTVGDDRTVQIGALAASSTTHACFADPQTYMFAGCSSAAEYVPTIDGGAGFPETADLVSLAPAEPNPFGDTHGPFVVAKSATPCDSNLLGFIVNPESGADGKKLNDHYLPLAIYGYFPAKVTTENGAIHRGDALTSSSKPGYAMKATQACKTVGYALHDATADGAIQVFAQHGETAAGEVASLRAQVKALEEQVATPEVATLRAQVDDLKKQNDVMTARLEALERVQVPQQSGFPPREFLAWGALTVVGVLLARRWR